MFARQGQQQKVLKLSIDFVACRKRRDAQMESLRLSRRKDKVGTLRQESARSSFTDAIEQYLHSNTPETFESSAKRFIQCQDPKGNEGLSIANVTHFMTFTCSAIFGATPLSQGLQLPKQLIHRLLDMNPLPDTSKIILHTAFSILDGSSVEFCTLSENDAERLIRLLRGYPSPDDLIDSDIIPYLCSKLCAQTVWQREEILNCLVEVIGFSFSAADEKVVKVLQSFPALLHVLCYNLAHFNPYIRSEVAWALSNLCFSTDRVVLQMIIEANIVPAMIVTMQRKDYLFDDQTEVELAWCLCNFTSHATHHQIHYIVLHGVVKVLCDCLHKYYHQNKQPLVVLILEALSNILVSQQDEYVAGNMATNMALRVILKEKVSGELIESIAMNCQNEEVSKIANFVVANFLQHGSSLEEIE